MNLALAGCSHSLSDKFCCHRGNFAGHFCKLILSSSQIRSLLVVHLGAKVATVCNIATKPNQVIQVTESLPYLRLSVRAGEPTL